MSKYRKKVGGKSSRKLFTKSAMRVHGKNNAVVMRGGYRM